MKLRTKFAIAILTVMIVLSTVVLGSAELFKQQTIADERRSLNETADLTARQIESTVETRREEVRLFAVRDVADPGSTGEYLPRFVNTTAFFAAQTVAPNGTIVDFRGNLPKEQREAAIGNQVGDRPHVASALQGSVAVSEPERVPGTNVTILKIAAPLYEESPEDLDAAATADGALVGAIYVDFSSFFTTARTVRTSEQSVAVYDVVDGERILLLPAEKSFRKNLTATSSFGIRGWEWTVRVTRDRSGLEARLDNLLFLQGVSLFLVLGSLVGLGVWEYRTNLKQAERLLVGFGAIRRGNYDYSLSLTAADEWERISDGYAELATGLAARESALREREQRLDVLNRVLRHNLRNEMSIVHNYADIIRDFTDDSQIESAASTILEAGEDLTSLSDKARQIRSAFEDADRRLEFDVGDLVADAIEPVAEDYPDVEIRRDVPDDVTVVGLPALDAAVENVVENACEHNDADDPAVDVQVEYDGSTDLDPPEPLALEFDGTTENEREAATADGGTAENDQPMESDDEASPDSGQSENDDAESPEEGPLEPSQVDTHETTGAARLTITDNGPGIPEHEYAVLTKGEETALEHGSGLGLWLVFWVVEKSGGELSFAERDPRGSVVTIELPASGPDDGA